jgi:hypothetical protein
MLASIEIRGRDKQWAPNFHASKAEIEAMRADGIEVVEIVNTGPAWIADMGLLRVWCSVQNIWNFNWR